MVNLLDAIISVTGVDGLLLALALLVVGVWVEVWWRIDDD